MDETPRVNVVDGFSHLINKILAVLIAKYVFRPAHFIEICVHMLKQEVDILSILRLEHFLQCNNIGMFQLKEKHYFPICPLGISRVRESIEVFLQGFDSVIVMTILDPVHMSIGPAAQLLNDFEPGEKMFFNLFTHGNYKLKIIAKTYSNNKIVAQSSF